MVAMNMDIEDWNLRFRQMNSRRQMQAKDREQSSS
jgi:hypothetical protein